jgi:hypothetical protein
VYRSYESSYLISRSAQVQLAIDRTVTRERSLQIEKCSSANIGFVEKTPVVILDDLVGRFELLEPFRFGELVEHFLMGGPGEEEHASAPARLANN